MWGSILTEANTLNNFNFGFSTHKSDILLHLSQWQYWWWFWFSLFWTVYFFLIIRVLNKRTFNFNPTLNTSIRGHGKWGDFLVALIPLSWCGNILVNSNFILRMIEWQNESSLFTIRVQGKQWYWVYKFDANAAQSIFAAPKNIGHNNWFITTPTESYVADSYYQALNLGTQLEFKALYYKYLSDDSLTQSLLNKNSGQTNSEFFQKFTSLKKQYSIFSNINKQGEDNSLWYLKLSKLKKIYNFKKISNTPTIFNKNIDLVDRYLNFNSLITTTVQTNNNVELKTNVSFYDYNQIDDLSNFAANVTQQINNKPIFFIRGMLNKHTVDILQKSIIDVSVTEKQNFYKTTLILLQKNLQKLFSIPMYKKKKVITLEERLKPTAENAQYWKEVKRRLNSDRYVLDKSPNRAALNAAEDAWEKQKALKAQKIKKFKDFIKFKKITSLARIKIKSWQTFTENFTDTTINTFNTITYIKKPLLFNILFNKNSNLVEKIEDNELLWGFRQKKYKRFKKFFFNRGFTYDSKTLEPIKPATATIRQLKNNVTGTNLKYSDEKAFDYHLAVKYNKHKQELVPVSLAKRLLRVKRTLVLPAHVNITLISNSYDVVHSWFIPGLGLKIDCVPGRSTHHTFYIDNIGFYYGQCAEICGRYHHHMPIRLCALSFEHFLVWWQKKGLKRLHRFNSLKTLDKTKNTYLHETSGKLIN